MSGGLGEKAEKMTTPDFEARAREAVDNWVCGELAKKDEEGLKAEISTALAKAYEEGRLHERKIALEGEPIDLHEAFGAIDE